MLTYVTIRFLAPIDAYPVNAAPCFESAPYNLDACLRLLPRTEDASLMEPAELIAIPFRAQSAASAHPRTAFNPHTFTALAT